MDKIVIDIMDFDYDEISKLIHDKHCPVFISKNEKVELVMLEVDYFERKRQELLEKYELNG